MAAPTNDRDTNLEEDDDDDPVEAMLKKAGCLQYHYAVQECITETKDWRQCQKEVQTFRNCIQEHNKQKVSPKKT